MNRQAVTLAGHSRNDPRSARGDWRRSVCIPWLRLALPRAHGRGAAAGRYAQALVASAIVALPAACTPSQASAAPDSGAVDAAKSETLAGAGLAPALFPAQAPRAAAPCTAIRAFGDVRARTGDQPLVVASGDAIPWPAWIDLGKDARLRVAVLGGDRELSFLGPAVVEPCTRGEERVSLLAGRLESAISERSPTAEEWVVTPFCVVRYENAALAITVRGDQVVVELSQGRATAFGEKDAGFSAVVPGARSTWSGAPVDLDGAAAAVGSCESEVTKARALDLKPRSLAADESARNAHVAAEARCAIAALRVAAVTEPSEARASLVLRLHDVGSP